MLKDLLKIGEQYWVMKCSPSMIEETINYCRYFSESVSLHSCSIFWRTTRQWMYEPSSVCCNCIFCLKTSIQLAPTSALLNISSTIYKTGILNLCNTVIVSWNPPSLLPSTSHYCKMGWYWNLCLDMQNTTSELQHLCLWLLVNM